MIRTNLSSLRSRLPLRNTSTLHHQSAILFSSLCRNSSTIGNDNNKKAANNNDNEDLLEFSPGLPDMTENTAKIMDNPSFGAKKTASGMTRAEASKQRADLAKVAAEFGKKHDMISVDRDQKKSTTSESNNNSKKYNKKLSQGTDSVVETASESTLSTHREQYEQKRKSKEHSFKVKRKAPWGAQQLRDAWSEDAMSRHDKDSTGERIDREYRYHPEAYLRKYIKWVGLAIPPSIVISFSVGYYWASGYSVYKVGDFQAILNILRQFDTSPRSALFLPKTAGSLSNPFELTEGEGPRRRRVGAREEYEALVKQYKEAKQAADDAENSLAPGGMAH